MKRTTKTGRTGKAYTLGRQGFAKISAVEGIKLSPEMADDFREFDRQELSPSERRKAIRHKYGKVTG
ncbi:MAG TPA: hypothetical protein VIJ62_01255 [Rhizomicrobium sp.]